MSIDQDITNLPTPPSRSDSPSDFSDKADAFLGALPQFQTELNTYADEANNLASQVNSDAQSASTSEQNAANSAQDAEDSALAASAIAGAEAWDSGITYNTNDAAIGSDGNTYRSLVDNNVGNDPVTDEAGNWLNLTGGAEVPDVTKGTLTKTFTVDETEQISLSESLPSPPVVSVTKEVPQVEISTNYWSIDASGNRFDVEDTAYNTSITPSGTFGTITLTLGSGSFASDDVGRSIVGNGGIAYLTDTSGNAEVKKVFNDTTTISSGEWSLQPIVFVSGLASLSSSENKDFFGDGSGVLYLDFNNNIEDELDNYSFSVEQGSESFISGPDIQYQQAIDFDGSYYLDGGNIGTQIETSGAISFWAKSEAQGVNFILQYGNPTNENDFSARIEQQDGQFQFKRNSNGNEVNIDRTQEQWEHFVFTWDGSNVQGYKNGQLFASTTSAVNPPSASGHAFQIATRESGQDKYIGALDEFRVFNRHINSSEANLLYLGWAGEQITGTYAAVTNEIGEIDSRFWSEINFIDIENEVKLSSEIYYALSNDSKETFYVFLNGSGERKIVRNNSGTFEYNTSTVYSSETWTPSSENNILSALEESVSVSQNQMTSNQVESVNKSDIFSLGDSLDLAVIFSSNDNSGSTAFKGSNINYDANVKNQGAVNGVDYEWDHPEPSIIRIKSLSNENFKVRVV